MPANGIEKSVKEAYRQVGWALPAGPRVVKELPAPPVEEPLPRLQVIEEPVTPVVMPTPVAPMRLDVDLLHSLAMVGLGIAIGFGAGLVAVFIIARR